MRNCASSSRPGQNKSKLKRAFQSAKSVDKKLKLFKEMEKLFPESELGVEIYELATELQQPEQVLSFGNTALRILIANDNNIVQAFGEHEQFLYIADVCNSLASACRKMNRNNECSSYLTLGYRNLTMLLVKKDSCSNKCLSKILLRYYKILYGLKTATGWIDEAVIIVRKVLVLEKRLLDEGCVEIGEVYAQVSIAYLLVMNYQVALPFCLNALDIYTKHSGPNSVDVAVVMSRLAIIYCGPKEYEKALEHNQLSQNIFTNKIPNSCVFFNGEISYGDILIGLGKYEEAIQILMRVVLHNGTHGDTRATAFVCMAKAFCYLDKFSDAKLHMRTAQRILEKSEGGHCLVYAAIRFRNMSTVSRQYEKIGDFENAISLLGRALVSTELPRKILDEGAARLFSLISLSGKVGEGIPYMEGVVEKLKDKFGAEDCEVAHGYRNLGAAYLKSGREELAAEFIAKAKDIMDAALGPRHLDSLKTSHVLAETYSIMGRYGTAINIQQNVVDGLKVLEPHEQEFLDKAVKLLNKMNDSHRISCESLPSLSIDNEDLSVIISTCGISEEEKGS